MLIYLWRHGKAEAHSESGKDEDRALAPEGRNEVIDVADFVFRVKGLRKPEKIFSSPFLRAKESAEMIQGFLACVNGLEIVEDLKSGTTFLRALAALAPRARDLKCFAVVGHVPDLEALAAGLGDGNPPRGIHLKPGGLVQIEAAQLTEPCRGNLLFSINPENVAP